MDISGAKLDEYFAATINAKIHPTKFAKALINPGRKPFSPPMSKMINIKISIVFILKRVNTIFN